MITPQEYTILLAEDDPNLNLKFFSQLKEKGFHVFPVYDGNQLYQVGSIKNVRENRNLVIVSDTDMPEKQGDEACKNLLDEFPEDYQKRIIIGMSEDPNNEKYWNEVENWHSFLEKTSRVKEENIFGERIFNRINTQIENNGDDVTNEK